MDAESCYACGGGLMGHSGVLWTPGETLWTPELILASDEVLKENSGVPWTPGEALWATELALLVVGS